MQNEVSELLEAAMYKEIAAQATYEAAAMQLNDSGARKLLAEIAEEEGNHLQLLKDFKEKGLDESIWDMAKIPDLKISDHLIGHDSLGEGSGIQDVIVFAMKREQEAVEFYSKMMSAFRTEESKRLCEALVQAELRHKRKLELMYDDVFYGED